MAVLYSIRSFSLSVCLSVLVPPVTRPFQTVFLRLAVYQTPQTASTNKHPQAGPSWIFYLLRDFFFLFPSILVSRARLFSACSFFDELIIDAPWIPLPPPPPPPRCSVIPFPLFSIIFPNGFFFAPCFYRPDSLSMRSTIRFYLLDLLHSRMFYHWSFWNLGFVLWNPKGKFLVPLSPWIVSFLLWYLMKSKELDFNLEKNWIPIILLLSIILLLLIEKFRKH